MAERTITAIDMNGRTSVYLASDTSRTSTNTSPLPEIYTQEPLRTIVALVTIGTRGRARHATLPVTSVISTRKQTTIFSIPTGISGTTDESLRSPSKAAADMTVARHTTSGTGIPESLTITTSGITTSSGRAISIPVETVVPNPKFAQTSNSISSGKKKSASTVFIIIGVLLGCLFLCIALFTWRYRRLRRQRQFLMSRQVDPLDLQETNHSLEPLGDRSITHRNLKSRPPSRKQTSKAPPQRRKGKRGVVAATVVAQSPIRGAQDAVEDRNQVADIILTAAAETATDRRGDERLDNQEINLIASRVAEILRSTDRNGKSSGEDTEEDVGGIAQHPSPDRRQRVSRSDSSILPPSEAPPTYRE